MRMRYRTTAIGGLVVAAAAATFAVTTESACSRKSGDPTVPEVAQAPHATTYDDGQGFEQDIFYDVIQVDDIKVHIVIDTWTGIWIAGLAEGSDVVEKVITRNFGFAPASSSLYYDGEPEYEMFNAYFVEDQGGTSTASFTDQEFDAANTAAATLLNKLQMPDEHDWSSIPLPSDGQTTTDTSDAGGTATTASSIKSFSGSLRPRDFPAGPGSLPAPAQTLPSPGTMLPQQPSTVVPSQGTTPGAGTQASQAGLPTAMVLYLWVNEINRVVVDLVNGPPILPAQPGVAPRTAGAGTVQFTGIRLTPAAMNALMAAAGTNRRGRRLPYIGPSGETADPAGAMFYWDATAGRYMPIPPGFVGTADGGIVEAGPADAAGGDSSSGAEAGAEAGAGDAGTDRCPDVPANWRDNPMTFTQYTTNLPGFNARSICLNVWYLDLLGRKVCPRDFGMGCITPQALALLSVLVQQTLDCMLLSRVTDRSMCLAQLLQNWVTQRNTEQRTLPSQPWQVPDQLNPNQPAPPPGRRTRAR